MKRVLFSALTALAVSAPAAALAATQGGEHAPLFSTGLLYHAINFAILAGILIFLLRKPVRDFTAGRRDDVRKAVEEAQAARTRAEAALAEYRAKMANVDAELAQLKAEILAAGEREKNQLLDAAKQQADKLIADAKLVGEQEVRRARETLRADMVAMAAELAAQQVAGALSAEDKSKQFGEFVSKLERLS